MTSFLFTHGSLRNEGKALALSLCVLSSCAPAVSRLPAIPPLSDVAHDDPARDAQARLLQEAYRAYVQERHPTSVLFLRRFIEDAPHSSRLTEARWWLGRAYEQLGDYRAAMAQYRLVTAKPLSGQVNGARYERQALRRLDELRRLHVDPHNRHARQLALRLAVNQLPPMTEMTSWLEELATGGVTALVIEPAPSLLANPNKHGFEAMKALASAVHDADLHLWVALDPHRSEGLELKPEWTAKTIAGLGQADEMAPRPDIANDGYQLYLEAIIRSLSRTGCDGIVLSARSVTGFAEEFSDDSLREFAKSFEPKPTLKDIFEISNLSNEEMRERSAIYWRWVGWKALRHARLVTRLRDALRKTSPTATLLIEVHRATLTVPVQGLEQYGEDLAELISRTGGFVVVRHEEGESETLHEQFGRQRVTMSDRMWVGASVRVSANPPSIRTLKELALNRDHSGQWNLLVHAVPGEAVP